MIQTIIFDFGKVIAFFDHGLITKRLAPHGDLPADLLHAFLFGGRLEDEYESGRLSTADFLAQLRAKACLRCTDDELIAGYADIFWPNPDVCALVPRLKPRYRLLLASNTSELHSKQFRRQFADTLSFFDGEVLSHEVGARKPSAAFFRRCLQMAGCPASACVFIDDLLANVAGAQACGLHGLVYSGIDDLTRGLIALGVQA
jgi:putative hydrolase of the HAD superfamily